MIPTLLLVGLVVGAFVHDRPSSGRSVVVAVAVSLLWGVGVGVSNRSPATFVGGTGLAFANVVIGAVVAALALAFLRLTARGGSTMADCRRLPRTGRLPSTPHRSPRG